VLHGLLPKIAAASFSPSPATPRIRETIRTMSFPSLGLAEPLLRAVEAEGYHTATPIQVQAIPIILAGCDVIGCAQTGTGKTAAFALPTLQRLGLRPVSRQSHTGQSHTGQAQGGRSKSRGRHSHSAAGPIRALVLSPTRELTAQIGASFGAYGRFSGLRHTVVYGGVSQHPQVKALHAGVDVLVATPGRLIDLMQQRHIDLAKVEILILDEADQMLDMGFLPDLRRIVARVPKQRQTLMFSATMPAEIRGLANEWLHEPKSVQSTPVATPADRVEQSVFHVEPREKPRLLAHFLRNTPQTRTLVFARTKHGADKIVKHLERDGIRAAAIHGNKSQSARQRVLEQFKSKRPPVLVATDIAARGRDSDAGSHVINYELPEVPEIYVHRIGRTARAGAAGIAVSFCGREERDRLKAIERLIRLSIRAESHEFESRDTSSSSSPHESGRPSGDARLAPSKNRPKRRRSKRSSSLPFPGAASGPQPHSRRRKRKPNAARG
jgi:ATP-dependent RNA helicase RhlE